MHSHNMANGILVLIVNLVSYGRLHIRNKQLIVFSCEGRPPEDSA